MTLTLKCPCCPATFKPADQHAWAAHVTTCKLPPTKGTAP